MVLIYRGPNAQELRLSEIRHVDAAGLLAKLGCIDDKEERISYALSHVNKKMPRDTPLSSLGLVEHSALRIVQIGPGPEPQPLNIKKLEECRRWFVNYDQNNSPYISSELYSLLDLMCDRDHPRKVFDKYPVLANDPLAIELIQDYYLLKSMVCENTSESLGYLRERPELVDAAFWFMNANRVALPPQLPRLPRLARHAPFQPQPHPPQAPPPAAAAQVISSDFLARAIQQAVANAARGQQDPAQPPQQPAAPPVSIRNYGPQLEQLHEFGFTEDAVNISVLESTNGNVEAALELLIVMREDAMEE